MKLELKTSVSAPIRTVWESFDKSLFKKLSPPFPPVKIIRFDGCYKGDSVTLELNFLIFRQLWTSLIIDQETEKDEIFFVDKGIKLPFFLKYWKHKHRLLRDGEGTTIVDEIEYRTPFAFLDRLMYPLLWAQFAYRKPIYRKVFAAPIPAITPPNWAGGLQSEG
jgi:ligand-binding SRPBCC domain-containing protein